MQLFLRSFVVQKHSMVCFLIIQFIIILPKAEKRHQTDIQSSLGFLQTPNDSSKAAPESNTYGSIKRQDTFIFIDMVPFCWRSYAFKLIIQYFNRHFYTGVQQNMITTSTK